MWVGPERRIEGGLADDAHVGSQTVMDAVGRHVSNAAVAMLVVVPDEEGLTMGAGVLGADQVFVLQKAHGASGVNGSNARYCAH